MLTCKLWERTISR